MLDREARRPQNRPGSRLDAAACSLHRLIISMAIPSNFGLLAFALWTVLVALWLRRRARAAGKLANPRRFASRRIADRDARADQALVRWDDDGKREQRRS